MRREDCDLHGSGIRCRRRQQRAFADPRLSDQRDRPPHSLLQTGQGRKQGCHFDVPPGQAAIADIHAVGHGPEATDLRKYELTGLGRPSAMPTCRHEDTVGEQAAILRIISHKWDLKRIPR
nr:hypothetical protein [Streptomyces sp. LUP47B]